MSRVCMRSSLVIFALFVVIMLPGRFGGSRNVGWPPAGMPLNGDAQTTPPLRGIRLQNDDDDGDDDGDDGHVRTHCKALLGVML